MGNHELIPVQSSLTQQQIREVLVRWRKYKDGVVYTAEPMVVVNGRNVICGLELVIETTPNSGRTIVFSSTDCDPVPNLHLTFFVYQNVGEKGQPVWELWPTAIQVNHPVRRGALLAYQNEPAIYQLLQHMAQTRYEASRTWIEEVEAANNVYH